MNDERFDRITCLLADAADRPHSRRRLLQALGLGGVAALTARPGPHFAVAARQTPAADSATAAASPAAAPAAAHRLTNGPTVEDKAHELEYDVDKIFRFVADEVQYDAYPGVLRGAKGTLWGRAGNSADQALLLAGLLDAALVKTRFVVGGLDDAISTRLIAGMRVDKATALAQARPVFVPGPGAGGSATSTSLSPEQQKVLQELPQQANQVLDAARTQLEAGVKTILDALASSHQPLPTAAAMLPDRERNQHVWLQYQSGADWVDLDPSLPGAESGKSYAKAARTLASLPDDLWHGVEIHVVGEAASGGQPQRQDLLTYTARSADLIGVPITFLHARPEALAGLGASLAGTLDGTVQYVPNLVVGNDTVTGTGRVTFGTGQGALSALGSSGNEGETLGEWLEIDVMSPGTPPQKSVRTILDRVGYVQRAAGTFDSTKIPPVELTDLGGESGKWYLPALAVWSIAIAGGRVPWEFYRQDYMVPDVFADLALVSQGFHYVREALQVELGIERGYRFYGDAPNAVAFTVTPSSVTAQGIGLTTGLDILHRSLVGVPIAGATGSAPPRVVAGVLSHVAERITLGEGQGAAGAARQNVSVGRIFEEAAGQGIAIRVVGPGKSDVGGLTVSAPARLRIAEAVKDGYVVIVPERSVSIGGREIAGWWQVDPKSGITLDQTEDGRGQETEEYTLPLTAEAKAIDTLTRLGGCLGKYSLVASAVLGVGAEAATGAGAAGIGAGLATAAAIAKAVNQVLGGVPATGLC